MRDVIAAVLVSAFTAASAHGASIAGSYVGQYECGGQWLPFELSLAEPVNGSSTGSATFPNRYRRVSGMRMPTANEPFKVKGAFDAGRGALTLHTDKDLMLAPRGKDRKVTFEGTLDAGNGYLAGTLDYPGCERFVLVPATTRGNPTYAAELYVSRLRGDDQRRRQEAEATAAHDSRLRAGWVSPELRPGGGAIEFPRDMLTYADARSGRAPDPFEEIRSIDLLNQLLIDTSFKCIGTAQVAWRGAEGLATTSIFSTKRYVVECDGRCGGVTYRVGRGGAYHHGESLPYPVVDIRTDLLTATPLQWQFARADANGEPPRIRIHTWTNGFDYGPRCQID